MIYIKNTSISKIDFRQFSVSFRDDYSTGIILEEDGQKKQIELNQGDDAFCTVQSGVKYSLSYSMNEDCAEVTVSVKNDSSARFVPESLSLCLGIDTYMAEFPDWNNQFFPTLLRCEKTHFNGYFMSPSGDILGIGCSEPIASYSFCYNIHSEGFGHRIYTVELQLLSSHKLPERHPSGLLGLEPGERLQRTIKLFPIKTLDAYESEMSRLIGVPMPALSRTAVALGERIKLNVISGAEYTVRTVFPDGTISDKTDFKAEQVGEYKFTVSDKNGKISEARAVCHRKWREYLIDARKAAYNYPQKATTHAESYYGFYSVFLAKKISPDPELDEKLLKHFNEVMPLMFDMEKGQPLLIPQRIQNTSTALGIFSDIYESDPDNSEWALEKGIRLAEFLLSTQTEDGAYRRGNMHYTCVIYIAKSMLEFSLTLKNAGEKYVELSEKYYMSAKRAIDDLVLHLDNIGTEGELTFEDGMISCSALQIGMYAITLPEKERKDYIDAAEYMLTKHRCLENLKIADYRMNGGSLRFWEAQYDVMSFHNFMNTPHGWTAWTAYASYYLYILTGKEQYLRQTYNTLGACTALMRSDGVLNWAFCADPVIKAECFVPDVSKPVKDAYENVPTGNAYRAKTEVAEFGECYIPMISDWYRTGKEQRVTGGYSFCPLILPNERINVDPQGGCCDNDVHEIFKCLEETLMDKAFIIETDGVISAYGCELEMGEGKYYITLEEDTQKLHINAQGDITLFINGKENSFKSGRYFLSLK